MALINFGNTVDMLLVGTPSFGETFVGYDLDGILKQKDYLGNITIIGGGGTGGSFSAISSAPLKGDGTLSNPLGLSMSSDFGLTNSSISLNLASTLLVTPVITSSWGIFKTNSVTPFPTTSISGSSLGSQSTLNTVIVPVGCIVNYTGTAFIPSAGSLYSPPTSIVGSYSFSSIVPPTTGTYSTSSITTGASFLCILSKPRTGLILSGSTIANAQVVRATGSDLTQGSAIITFNNIFYYGYIQIGPDGLDIDQVTVDTITPTQIQNLGNYRWGRKAQSSFVIDDTLYGSGYRFVFAYLASDGDVTNILTSLAPGINVVGSYLKMTSDVSITTLSGEVLTYRVWVAKPNNSYNNVTMNTIS